MGVTDKLALVPHIAGVYQMRDAFSHVIYIGKAKDLYKRLASYFISKSHDQKTTAMLSKVADFDYFVCESENDALCLESNLIKRHKPHYNILLKDNKTFPYILITNNKIEITRLLNKRGKYFGPYFNGIWASGLLDTIYDIFGIRGSATGAEISNIKDFLSGANDFGAYEILTQKMQQASELQQYELAIRYRNGLRFLDRLKERTITEVGRDVNCDVFGFASSADIFVVSVLTIRAGKLIGVQNFANQNASPKSDEEKLEEFIAQYYLENIRPQEVILQSGGAIKGYKKRLVEMSQKNAQEYISVSIEKIEQKTKFTMGACEDLRAALGLSVTPKKIECFDISHMGGEGVVASMAVFIDGAPAKKLYRKFKLRHGEGNNDFLSMQEVLSRRLNRVGGTDDSFATLPDLIVIDGGKGQVSSVRDLIEPKCAFIGFGGEYDSVVLSNGKEIILDRHSYALHLLERIRDEAHRFAVGYQKKVYKNKSMS